MELRNTYPGVALPTGVSFGGNQKCSLDAVMRRCGCGVVAAADLLLYLHRWHDDCTIPPLGSMGEDCCLTQSDYEKLTCRLREKYFPLIDPLGVNGLTLMLGLNRLFRRWSVPYRARWGVPWAVFWETMEEMLRQDLPVILAVGPNFPELWKKEKLCMVCEGKAETTAVRAHYVVVTAMNEKSLTVSSWGKRFEIDRLAYSRYVRQYSSPLVSNLLWLRPKKETD